MDEIRLLELCSWYHTRGPCKGSKQTTHCHTGDPASSTGHPADGSYGEIAALDWAPCDPADGRCHFLLVGNRLIPCRFHDQPPSTDGKPGIELLVPPGAQRPLTLTWHAWCWDEAHQLHLVYNCKLVSCFCGLYVAVTDLQRPFDKHTDGQLRACTD